MTDKVNPSLDRPAESYKTAGSIAYGGHGDDGFVIDGSNPTDISIQDVDIDETALDTFENEYGVSYDTSSEDTSIQDVSFNGDGTLLYVVGTSTDSIYEYSLSTAYDITTASLNDSLDLTATLTTPDPTGMKFNGDGSKLFVTDAANANVAEYALSTLYDISTASLNSTTDVSTEDGSPQDIEFNSDGTLMYVVGDGTDSIYEYTLSTAYDASTLTLNDSLSVSTQDATPTGMALGNAGAILYVTGATSANVYEYSLGTSYDISTATFTDSLDVSGQESTPTGLTTYGSGYNFVVTGSGTNFVYRYPVEVQWDVSTAVYSDVIINAGEGFIYGAWVAIDSPSAVTLSSNTEAQTVYLGWDESIGNTVIIGLDAAFSSGDKRVPIWEFDTDASGVTAAEDYRQIGETINAAEVSILRSVASNRTLRIGSSDGMVVSGPFTVDGRLYIEGSFTDTIGPISGTGSLTGTGTIKVID